MILFRASQRASPPLNKGVCLTPFMRENSSYLESLNLYYEVVTFLHIDFNPSRIHLSVKKWIRKAINVI